MHQRIRQVNQVKSYLHTKVNPLHFFAAIFHNDFVYLPLTI